MPRVTLTRDQREAQALKQLERELLDRMNEKRGRENKTKHEFAKELGVSKDRWMRWNKDGMAGAEFGKVMIAAMRSGIKIKVEIA